MQCTNSNLIDSTPWLYSAQFPIPDQLTGMEITVLAYTSYALDMLRHKSCSAIKHWYPYGSQNECDTGSLQCTKKHNVILNKTQLPTFLQADTQSSPLLSSRCPNHLNLPNHIRHTLNTQKTIQILTLLSIIQWHFQKIYLTIIRLPSPDNAN